MPQPGQMTEEEIHSLKWMRTWPPDAPLPMQCDTRQRIVALIDRLLAAQQATASELLRLREIEAAAREHDHLNLLDDPPNKVCALCAALSPTPPGATDGN